MTGGWRLARPIECSVWSIQILPVSDCAKLLISDYLRARPWQVKNFRQKLATNRLQQPARDA